MALNIESKTSCDTEVIIEAFEEWGVTFCNKLNGIFAISIYDKQDQIMYLFRDRLGVKPLFYYWDGEFFAFASEIKSLLKVKKIRETRQINNLAISELLNLGFIPEPDTIYTSIKKFPSGEVGILSVNGFRTETFWDVEGIIRRNLVTDYAEAKSRLKDVIESSVKMQLMSDVPYGTFLSGGIDSSLVTSVASKVCSGKLNTFSIGFADKEKDESQYAKKIAEYLGTQHHEYFVTEQDACDMVGDMLEYFDEPFADSSLIPTMMVSKMAKQNVSMVLSGDGGDELFHGYGAYIWAKRMQSLGGFKELFANMLGLVPSNRYRRAAWLFRYKNREHLKSHIFSQEQYLFSELELQSLLQKHMYLDTSVDQDYSNYVRKLTPAEAQAIFDIKYYLKDDLLVKVDRASMKYGLEARVPLLDHRIVELALNISPKFKINNGIQKYILKDILYDYIPKEYFNRKKSGFSIPLQRWLLTDLSYLIDDYLNE
ncbi:MAG: asparagine synthase (glutamine-hydrolyzing), partial [Bacteroidales bacterium]|nr:asparagine synthase (glutamine-hydrolyzing) [Bacteroidales bacterium]